MSGDVAATKEFHELTGKIAEGGGDDVAIAMSGNLPDIPDSSLRQMAGTAEMLRDMGFPPTAISETLSNKEATQADVDRANVWKKQQ
jgi:hypothetical protein